MRIIIVAPQYDENSGGSIALHKLCHCINELGGNASLHPYVTEYGLGVRELWGMAGQLYRNYFAEYRVNPEFRTPVIRWLTSSSLGDAVVVYPEIVSGNPLGAKRVVRWFLHHPGYHSGQVNYFCNELYFSYGNFGLGFSILGSKLSNLRLEVTHFFNEFYNRDSVAAHRHGTAYCLRKGSGRQIVHELADSILIDGMSHREVSSVLKRANVFVTYDLYTAYTWFAILCGCVPVVVPQDGLSKNEWYADANSRLGVAYGFNEIDLALSQQEDAISCILGKEDNNRKNVSLFLDEIRRFFWG